MNATATTITLDTLSAAVGYPVNPKGLSLRLSQYHSANDDGTAGFIQRWGKRITAVGGTYERVQYESRSVKLPLTNEALALADELLRADPKADHGPDRLGWDHRPRVELRGMSAWLHHTYDSREPWVFGEMGVQLGRGGSLSSALRDLGSSIAKAAEKGQIAHPDKIAEVAELARQAKEKVAAEKVESERATKVRDAAEDMLAALRKADVVIYALCAALGDDPHKSEALTAVRAAIAKATGDAP